MGDSSILCNVKFAMMRYSEIPSDFSSDNLRFTQFPEDRTLLRDDSPPSDVSTHSGPLISPEASSPSNGYCNYGLGVTISSNKSKSLPPNTTIQNLDSIILSALRVQPEELANQITLLDYPVFAEIQPDELTSCSWTKKNKHTNTPNIVAFTKRFNDTCYWTVQEILSGQTAKHRAEILSHFIKVAKKLFDLNNLHSLYAIISAMQCVSIHRLEKTWSSISKKDKQTFDRLSDIFNEKNNRENLREYLESLKLPCIPFLGLFLTDLVFIDSAYPHFGGLEPEPRKLQMNNILRVISSYQGSDYSHILINRRTQKYLQSIRYFEELQSMFEDEQFKKSLKLEPPLSSCSSKESVTPNSCHLETALASLNLSPAKTSGSVRITAATVAKFTPGHRKCRSLGSKFRSTSLPRNFHQKCHCPIVTSGVVTSSNLSKCCIFNKTTCEISLAHNTAEQMLQSRHLLDDSVIVNKTDATSTGSSEGVVGFELDCNDFILDGLQGSVRRKTLLKTGKKPAVASWQRYWLQIWSNSLLYFGPKSFKGNERSDFKREPCKECNLEGWTAEPMENIQQTNVFQLINISTGTIYKIRTGSPILTTQWLEAIRRVSHQNTEIPLPGNLINFE